MSRKDLYDKTIENSAVSWCNLYREEKAKREAIEERYKLLIQEIKQQGKERVVDGLHFVDFGAGPVEIHHKVNEEEYWAKLRELPDDI